MKNTVHRATLSSFGATPACWGAPMCCCACRIADEVTVACVSASPHRCTRQSACMRNMCCIALQKHPLLSGRPLRGVTIFANWTQQQTTGVFNKLLTAEASKFDMEGARIAVHRFLVNSGRPLCVCSTVLWLPMPCPSPAMLDAVSMLPPSTRMRYPLLLSTKPCIARCDYTRAVLPWPPCCLLQHSSHHPN